ncbi:hypothetical protein GQX73_g2339 [Xylaria multiplex]|uniref:Uncharacterized protein n=1 Tax=Xylaria multiplex TaxID=323545 RepID=A0A7C8MXZ9_9PEZI|nr:hypothetical protein GQX73_g2339 [Xylaria multiplex]
MTTFGTGNASQTLRMKQLNTLIWSMSIIRAANSTHSSVIWPDVPIHATECALFYCINKYHNVVQNGDLIQEITPVESLRSPLSWQPENDIGVAISDPTRASSIEFDDYYSYYTRSDLHLVSSETGHAFNISQNAVNGISSYFQQNFATDTTNFPLNDSDSDIDDAGQLNGAYFTLGSELSIPGVLQVFFNSENLSSTFAGLATSMSNTLRDFADDIESDGIGKMQTGKTQVVAVLYTIQWPWITIHGVVIAAGWVFLVTTIRINQRYGQGREAFKSNALAVLSRGSIVYHTIGKTQSMSQMERIARNTEVCLFPKTPTGSQLEPGEFGPS